MSEFQAKMDGMLYSLLSWEQLTAFWQRLDTEAGWYVYAVGQETPQQPSDAKQVTDFISRIDTLLHAEHQERYCGIVYADDVQTPNFVVIYDPSNLGVSCGSSKHRVMPGWVMSRMRPDTLNTHVVPNNRKRWWNEFLNASSNV
ncbi:MAG: hypothetical protein M0Z83_08650 [Betaproteobacteria bacterium]|nr:hypothetical protein [Betaproteobacteria bacterium]